MSDYRLLWRFFQHPSKWCTYSAIWLLHGWCQEKLLPPWRTFSVYHRLPPCTSLQCHFMQSHILRVHVCSAVTCHLHFWQNDREYFHSTAVTQGWNGYQNKSQHRMDPSTAQPLSRFYRKVSQAAAGKRACEPV